MLLFDGKAGPTDEWGEPRTTPVFRDLVDSGQAVLLDRDNMAWGATDTLAKEALAAVQESLGGELPLTAATYGRRVDAGLLEKSATEKFVFLVNWERAGGTCVDLGIALEPGTYEVFLRDMDFWYRIAVDGRADLSAGQLRRFRLVMVPETGAVLYIRRKGES